MNMKVRKVVAHVCVMLVTLSGLASVQSQAAMIGTDQAVQATVSEERAADLANVRAYLDREDVQERFASMGVAQEEIDDRLASLTDDEVAQLSTDLEDAPAGGVLEAILVFLLILIVLFHWHPHHGHSH